MDSGRCLDQPAHMGAQRSLSLSPFTAFPSALSDFPFSYFLKSEVSFGPKCENIGN